MIKYYSLLLLPLFFSCSGEEESQDLNDSSVDSSLVQIDSAFIPDPNFDFNNCPKAWSLEEAMVAPDSFCTIALLPNDDVEKLTEIPEELKEMHYLRSLYIDRNRITHIPAFLYQLEELWMGQSVLKECPTGLENLKSLKVLDLAYNQITELDPIIFDLKDLEVLSMFNNNLTEISPEIGKLKQLKTLAISGNQIEKLPVEITQLTQLEELYLNDMGLGDDAFPAGMEKLKNLKKLSIGSDMSGGGDGNSFSQIPDWIYELDSLEELWLNFGYIESVSSKIGNLKNLKTLSLEGNNIPDLPSAIFGLDHLQHLYLGENDFHVKQMVEIRLNLREDIEVSFEVEVGC